MFFSHKRLIYYRTRSSCRHSWCRVKSFSMTSKGSTCEASFTAQSATTSCSSATYKRSRCLCLKVHLLPWDKIQTSVIIIACTDDTWQWIACECSALIWSCWALKWFPKLSNLCTWNDIDYSVTLSMHFGSRWLWSSLTTLSVSLPERSSTKWYNTEHTHITALGHISDRIEMACCHIRARMGFTDVFMFGFHMTRWWQDYVYSV